MAFLHIDMAQVVETLSWLKPLIFYIVNIMGADILAMQGAKTSATMIFIMLDYAR